MKLAEALIQRSDIQKNIAQLRERLILNVLTGQTPPLLRMEHVLQIYWRNVTPLPHRQKSCVNFLKKPRQRPNDTRPKK